MRDPNEITSADRERWLQSTLAGLKKLSEAPGSKPQAKSIAPAAAPTQSSPQSQTDVKPKLIPPSNSSPVSHAVSFSEKRSVRGVEDSPKFKSKFEKQLRKDIKSVAGREELVKSFVANASFSGRMSARDAKRAILAAHESGKISRHEVRGLLKRMGI